MKPLSFIATRVFILLLIALAAWLSKDGMIRYGFTTYGQTLTGAKVEIDQLQTNASQGRVFIKGLKVADPRNTMSNLVQADMVYLKFDSSALWNKKFVVTEGQVNGLLINAPRTKSGALDGLADAQLSPHEYPEKRGPKSKVQVGEVSQTWLNRLDPNIKHSLSTNESESLLHGFEEKWTQRIQDHRRAEREIQPKLTALTAGNASLTKFPNPLRDRQFLENSFSQIDELQSDASKLRANLLHDQAQLKVDILKLNEVVERDCNQIRLRKPVNQFDENLVSELLTCEENQELVDDVVGWLSWFKNSLALSSSGDDLPVETGYQTFRFQNNVPDFVIQQIELEGNGWFAKQHVNFIGTAFNVSPQPALLKEPTRIELRALGKSNALVNFWLDRTNGKQTDKLQIQFPDLEFPQRKVGDERSMTLTFGGNRKAISDVQLTIDGNRINGEIKLRYTQVSMYVDTLCELLGGEDIRLLINQGLSQIDRFETVIRVDGTLDDYRLSTQSSLGNQLARAVDSAVIERVEQENHQLMTSFKQRKEQILRKCQDELQVTLQNMEQQLGQDIIRIAELKDSLDSNGQEGWRKLR